MRIIRVFPRRTSFTPQDELAFSGRDAWPGLFRPGANEVHVSCLFLGDRFRAEGLAEAWDEHYPGKVLLGGPAFDDPGDEFTLGRYVREGITITSRGCPRQCPWCVVPKREGKLRTLTIYPGNNLVDNNLLACPEDHQEAVFEMLRNQKRIIFSGGLDARLLEDWHVEEFKKLSIRELWFASDTPDSLKPLRHVSEMFEGVWNHLSVNEKRRRLRCYVLIGFGDETPDEAKERLKEVWRLGFLPFAQFYRGLGEQIKTSEWADLQRRWSRPAVMFADREQAEMPDGNN